MLEWRDRASLTAYGALEVIARCLVVESLFCLAAFPFPPRARVIDIGTGAGFPGVPLAVLRPDLDVTLLEASRRKVAFLEMATQAIGLAVRIIHGRAEDIARQQEHREGYGVVVSRAAAPLRIILELALPLLAVGGAGLFSSGARAAEEVASAGAHLAALGGVLGSVWLPPPALETVSRVVVVTKVARTPERFPRRFQRMRRDVFT